MCLPIHELCHSLSCIKESPSHVPGSRRKILGFSTAPLTFYRELAASGAVPGRPSVLLLTSTHTGCCLKPLGTKACSIRPAVDLRCGAEAGVTLRACPKAASGTLGNLGMVLAFLVLGSPGLYVQTDQSQACPYIARNRCARPHSVSQGETYFSACPPPTE